MSLCVGMIPLPPGSVECVSTACTSPGWTWEGYFYADCKTVVRLIEKHHIIDSTWVFDSTPLMF